MENELVFARSLKFSRFFDPLKMINCSISKEFPMKNMLAQLFVETLIPEHSNDTKRMGSYSLNGL